MDNDVVGAPYGAEDARQDGDVAGFVVPDGGAVEATVRALFERGFRLGGSRRMAQKFPDAVVVGPHTDWDFYGGESPANHNLLQMMGFGLLDCPNRDYWDDLLVSMYQHPTMPIQVLLRSDTETYTAAFESIDATTFVTKLWKSSPLLLDYMSGGHFKETVCAYFNEMFRSTSSVSETDRPSVTPTSATSPHTD